MNGQPVDYTDEEWITRCKKKALRILELSDKTEKQLTGKLKEGGFPPFAVEEAVSYVKSFHYIDDRHYAEVYVHSKSSHKSIRAIKQELLMRGVSGDIIEAVLNSEENTVDEVQAVRVGFLKKYAAKAADDPSVYEKAFRYFLQKGYGYEAVKKGIREALEKT